MSNRSLRARSGSAKAFLLFFIFVCALSTWNAHAAGSYVAALPDDEIRLEIEVCSLRANGAAFAIVRSSCLVASMQKRWMNLYNRAIDTLNQDVNLACDETHAIFDNTSERVSKEYDILANGVNGGRPAVLGDHKAKLRSYAEREIIARLTNGRGARDTSCTSSNASSNGGGNSRSLTNNTSGDTSNPATPPGSPPLTAPPPPRVTGLTAASEPTNANVQNFTGPRVATSNISGSACANREAPACDGELMRCLRGCNSSSGSVDACNASCQSELLSCRGCGN